MVHVQWNHESWVCRGSELDCLVGSDRCSVDLRLSDNEIRWEMVNFDSPATWWASTTYGLDGGTQEAERQAAS